MRQWFPATFYTRIFRVLITVGLVAACQVAFVISALDITTTRRFVIEGVRQETRLAAGMMTAQGAGERFAAFSSLFAHPNGPEIVCMYNKENRLARHWQAKGYNGHCPALVRALGIHESLFFLSVAEPIQDGTGYHGLVYAEAELIPRETTLPRVSAIFTSLILVALLVCTIAAYYAAKHMNHLMDAIRQQIECLKDNARECVLPTARATHETMALYDAIRSLRVHLMTSLVPRETVAHLRAWYENMLFSLLSLVRQRISGDAVLTTLLSDCELFLRLTNPDNPLPEPEVTDIGNLVDEALASARLLHPPGSQLHLVASLKTGGAREWKAQASYISALMRHLLLIGLARTREGFICLRLEIALTPDNASTARLIWQLEDSGPPVQPGELHSRLLDVPYKIVSVTEASWLLAVQLTKRLKGTIRAENTPGGLLLQGEIPLEQAEKEELSAPQVNDAAANRQCPPLALIVGDASSESRLLCQMLEQLRCRVFWAVSPVEALELAPAAPFSVILLSPSLPERDGHTLARRLLALMDNKRMPAVPVWVVTPSPSLAQQQEWSRAGVEQILPAPVEQEKLALLCQTLTPMDRHFWSVSDQTLVQEFSHTMVSRLPQMRADLLDLIHRVQAAINTPLTKSCAPEVLQEAHAVKSSALALGYMRLAALIANLEYRLTGRLTEPAAKNIAAIAECLTDIVLE